MTFTQILREKSRALLEKAFVGDVDAAWLSAFRLAFGLTLTISMARFIGYGWIERMFVEPKFFFKYYGFAWVEPLTPAGMHSLFVLLLFAAFCTAIGFCFRIAAFFLALGLSYIQLIDVSNYLNHYYLAALLAWLLAISPAGRAYSLDAFFAKKTTPSERPTVWAGWYTLFRAQLGIVYTFAGIAKAQPDWLLHAQPLRIWLGANTDIPLLGVAFTWSWVPLFMSWFGFLFDISIAWWLLASKTRPYAYVVVLLFHLATRLLFPIGMFPVIMTLGALVFFSPSWPRVALGWLEEKFGRARPKLSARLASFVAPSPAARISAPRSKARTFGTAVALSYLALQLLLPLRFLAYGGNVLWHEQGMRFSWRVMVRAKGGSTTFRVRDPKTAETWEVSPSTYLNGLQENEMTSQPDLIVQLAHHIRDDYEAHGRPGVQVFVDARAAMNGRRGTRLIAPDVDLTQVEDGLSPAHYVLPAPSDAPRHTRAVR